MPSLVRLRNPKPHVAGFNLDDGDICVRPGHVEVAHHWGISPLELRPHVEKTLFEEFHPYGTSAFRSKLGTSDVSAKRYRYTGKERDEETGLYYHGARYYMCWLARWANADPLGVSADGPGLFTYVRG